MIARRPDHPGDGQGDVPGAVDGQDPRAAALREARRRRPRGRGRRGDAPRAAGVTCRAALVDYFAAEPVRVSAVLRLPLIALIGVLVWIWEVDSWLPGVYAAILGAYAVIAVLWVVAVLRGPVPRWADWASTGVDVLLIVVLCVVSGGATAALLPVFFLLPLSVAFEDRPVLTGDPRDRHRGVLSGGVDRLLQARRPRRPARHGLPAVRVPAVAGGRHDRAVPGADPCARPGWRRCWTCAASWSPSRCRPTNGPTGSSPSTCTTARCRPCSPPGWNSTRSASASPTPRWTWSTRRCSDTAARAARRRSPRCIRRCSRSSA